MKWLLVFTTTLVLLFSSILYSNLEMYEEVVLPEDSDAKCLDGSPYKFMIKKGFDSGVKNFIIYFESGGWFGERKSEDDILTSCVERSKINLGTNINPLSDKLL